MLYLCKKVRIMFQDNEYIGFVTYTQGKRNRKIPFGIVSQSYKQKAIVTHYSRKIRKNLIAIEDKRYFSHLGIDIKSISRALYMNIKARRIIQGGSTITQQLARNLFEDHSITFHRKIKEILYAISLEREHKKLIWNKSSKFILFYQRALSLITTRTTITINHIKRTQLLYKTL